MAQWVFSDIALRGDIVERDSGDDKVFDSKVGGAEEKVKR